MKKTLLLSIFVLCFGLVPRALAEQDFVPLAVIPGLTDLQPTAGGLAAFFNNLYKYLIGLAAVLAIIEIIWGGLEYSTQDSVSGKSNAKERITNAIFGLVLVLSPVLVFSIINPSILNLSLNLEALPAPPPRPGPGPVDTPTPDPTSGCTVSGTSGVLQVAQCPSSVSVQTWVRSCTGLSTSDPLTRNTDGTITSYVATCQGQQSYVFLNMSGIFDPASTINQLRPLARTADNPNNGSSATQFVNACQSVGLGWKTCIKGVNWISDVVTCPPTTTAIPPSVTPKCYQKTLICGDNSFWYNNTCSSNPGWVPFQ